MGLEPPVSEITVLPTVPQTIIYVSIWLPWSVPSPPFQNLLSDAQTRESTKRHY